MTVKTRLAHLADLEELAQMRYEWAVEDGLEIVFGRDEFIHTFVDGVTDAVASGRWTIWVAEVGDAIVSHVFLGLVEKVPRPTRQDRWIGYVTNVYTRPEFRGVGIGGKVLDRIKAWSAEHDVELLFVWPSDESVGFYERAGFESTRDPLVWERT